MPRQARLDAPDTLHHVLVRGLERRRIFRDDTDRREFVARVGALAEGGAVRVYAWALLPTHAHLWMEGLGHPGRPLAGALGVGPQAVYQAVARGRETRREWERVLKR